MSDLFGNLVTGVDVKTAIRETLATWLPTYQREIERRYELPAGSLEAIATETTLAEFAQPQDMQLPACVIVCPGTSGDPERDGNGNHAFWWPCAVVVLVEAKNQAAATDYADYFAGALAMLFSQRKGLDGKAVRVRLTDIGGEPAPASYSRSGCGIASVGFDALFAGVVTDTGGPTEPSDDPAPWPTVETVHIDAERLTA